MNKKNIWRAPVLTTYGANPPAHVRAAFSDALEAARSAIPCIHSQFPPGANEEDVEHLHATEPSSSLELETRYTNGMTS